jgi:hypothetical protein
VSSGPTRWRELRSSIQNADALDLACRLTLVLPAVSDWVVGEDWVYKAPLRVLAIAGLIVPGWHRSRLLWAALAAVMVAKTGANWWLQDNHVFLLTYWTIALALALHLPAPRQPLRTSARLLVGWSFVFATLWKLCWSPDFVSGAYFHYTFITDPRFFAVAALVVGVDPEMLQRNLVAVDRLFTSAVVVAELGTTGAVDVLAACVTWWTIVIEAAIAVTFLWPENRGPSRLRDVTLLTFAATTYLVAAVWTFGWTLLTLGLCQVDPARTRMRLAYVAMLLLVLTYDLVPIGGIATGLLGRARGMP